MIKKSKTPKIKVGTYIRAKEKNYTHVFHEGVVTESFSDMIQIYGSGYSCDLGFIELRLDEIIVFPIDKEKLRFTLDQKTRKLEANLLKAEHKLKELQNDLKEASENKARFLI